VTLSNAGRYKKTEHFKLARNAISMEQGLSWGTRQEIHVYHGTSRHITVITSAQQEADFSTFGNRQEINTVKIPATYEMLQRGFYLLLAFLSI
jgi:hypothetical protein